MSKQTAAEGAPVTSGTPASPTYSIVIPIHNEAECLAAEVAELVGGLEANGVDYEVLLAENGSSDETAAIGDKLAAANRRIRLLRVPVADYGAAMKAGMLEGRGAFVVNFDIDLHDVDFMLKAGEALGTGAGIVVGSKLVEVPTTAGRGRGTWSRWVSPPSCACSSTAVWTTPTA